MESSMEDVPFHGKQRPVPLIADEDDAYCRQVRRIFESRYQIVEASDGEKALACIASYENKIGAAIISLYPVRTGWISDIGNASEGTGSMEYTCHSHFMGRKPGGTGFWIWEADEFLRKPHTAAVLERRAVRAMRSAASRGTGSACLRGEACQDYLTGLLNRRGLRLPRDALDGKDMPLAVYLFDLDNLKTHQ